jgi:hypothetical protein
MRVDGRSSLEWLLENLVVKSFQVGNAFNPAIQAGRDGEHRHPIIFEKGLNKPFLAP